MSDVRPPDGHWHRRTPAPVRTSPTRRTYGCVEPGCEWQVLVNMADRSEVRLLSTDDRAAAAVEYDESLA